MNEKLLKDFIATAQKNNYNWNTVFDKFPELENYDKQLLKDYVATAEKNNYNYEVVNSKFPEFGFKKKSQTENGGSTLGVGSSVSPKTDGDYTYGDNKSMYRKQGENWLINNESTGGQYVDLKDPTGSRAKELNRNARKMSSLDIKSEQASKEISKTKDLSNIAEADSEIFTGYPGKEKNQYEFRGENWYEPNPEVEKTIQRETEKRKSLVGTAYEKTIAINIKNAIKDIPKTRVIKDDARIKALNKQFGKNAVAPIPSEVPLEKAQKTDQDYFTGAFGDVLRGFDNIVPLGFGDLVDDIARDVASGYRQGKSDEESFNIGLKGSKASYKEIQQFIDAKKNAEQLAPSAEMQNYQRIYEEEGKGFWGVVKGLANNPSVIPSVLVSSITGMATNSDAIKAGAAAVGTGATYGAATGATAGGVGAIPGAAAGAVAAVPYAFGLASSVVEMGATFGELLTEELKGKELTKENVKAILEDPKKLQSIRNKAIARGIIIGAADALTGKLASGVGAKIISKSAAKSATGAVTKSAVVKSTAAGAAIEAAGGSAGEATARGAIGQDMDVSEIALEGIAELPGGIRSTIQARLAKPSYKVNGAKATSEQVDELINTMTPDDLAKTKIEIKNDYEGREFKMQDKIVTNSIKQQVKQGNPELNEPSLNAITQLEKDLVKLEGNTTQTGKDKAAAIRTQIKNIQENQLQEEATAEAVIPEEISSLEDDEVKVLAVKTLEEIPEQFRDRAQLSPLTEVETREKIFGLPIGKKGSKLIGGGYTYTLTGKEAKDYAIQEQTAGEVPVQPTTAVGEEVVQREPTAEPQVLTEEGKAEEIKKALENLDDTSWYEIDRLKVPNYTKDYDDIVALNLPTEEYNKRVGKLNKQYEQEVSISIEEAYIKAKKDGSNPELVKAVEELLTPTTQEVAPLTLEEELQVLAEEQAKAPKAPVVEAPTLEAPVIEAPTLETPVVEVEATPQEKVATYRAEEQAELLKAIPKIESYKVKGKIDKTKMPRTVLAKYNKISEKYNALISPLLEPVVETPVVKAEATKTKGELPKMRWDDVEKYDDAVIMAMREIQNKLLTPLLALKYNTTAKQKKQIIDIRAKIELADKILKRNFARAKREQAKIEKEKNIKPTAKVEPTKAKVKAEPVKEEVKAEPTPIADAEQDIASDLINRKDSEDAKNRKDINHNSPKIEYNGNSQRIKELVDRYNNLTRKVEEDGSFSTIYGVRLINNLIRKGIDSNQTRKLSSALRKAGLLDTTSSQLSRGNDISTLISDTSEFISNAYSYSSTDRLAATKILTKLAKELGVTVASTETESNRKVEKIEGKAEPAKAEAKAPVKEEAPAPAKESTDDLMGVINSIKEEIDEITKDIKDLKTEARKEVNKIEEEKLETTNKSKLEDLNDEITVIEDDLEKALIEPQKELDGKIKELKEEVKKIEELDAKNPENKNTLIKYIDAAIKTLNGLNKLSYVKLDLGVTVATLKLILKGIRAGVILTGDIKGSIRAMAKEYRNEHKNKKITIAEFTKEIEEYLRNTFVDQKTNEQDIQETRAKFVEIREAVRKAKVAVKTKSKALRANAFDAIQEMLKGKVKKLSAVQMKSIMLRLARFNVFSQTQYDKFIDYVDKVIGIADYDAKVNEANKNRKTAKKNTIGNKPKLGDITPDLFRSLSIMLNIDAKLIPSDVFESYYKIVDMLSKRDTVLQLEQRSFLNENVDKIIASIELNDEKISDLKELYDNFEKVKEDGKVDYSGTLAKMLKDDVINQDEYELMKTFKSKIVEAKVKDKMTEQEIADEKAELINEVNNTTITLDEIVGDEFRLERELAKRLQVLLKQTDLKNLNNKDLKKLLIIIDNINNGFVSNATQLMVEKLNSTKKSIPLATSVHAKITSLYNKMNRFISKTFSRDEFRIAVAPLNLIDEQFGDFQTKNIYNSVFKDSAKAQQAFEAEISKIRAELTEIEKSLDKFFDKDHNKKVASKIKMMIYMLQIEKNSNPNSNKVHNAIDILDATIKFSKENSKKSKNSKADLKVLESIRENFVKDEQIDMDELFNSFGAQEKNALKKLQEINNSMTKKAAYTATVINGNKITTFDNYIFHNTISASDDMSVDALVNNISDNMQPTTKSKNLEERGDKALAMNLNPFLAVTVSSRSVLLNYHLTEPIRTARKTLIDTIKLLDAEKANGEKNKMTSEERKDFEAATKEQYDILNAIKDAYETATKDLLTSNFTESKQWIDWISRQGYRAVLASAPRAVAEITSNALFVLSAFRKEITIGFNDTFSLSNSSDAKNILESLGSSLISRLYSEDSLSSVWLDTSAFANRISRDGKMKPKMVNGVLKFHDKYTGRWVDAVSFMADNLIAKPDQAIMRPLWFGSFVNSFKNKTGVEPDFNKIKENDEAYMDEYRDALEEARDVADNNADLTGGNMNPYMSSLQNVIRKEDSFPKVWLKTFQKYMNKFTVKEYYTARKGVRALVGDGDITQKQGRLILTGVALRMTIYTTVTRLLSEFIMYSFGLGDDDGEEDDDYNAKHIGRKLYQGFTSMLTTLILGRRFGNVVRMAENYFIEWANETYGEDIGLRNGEYDPYEDAVQFNQLQDGKIDKTTDLVKVIAGPYAPVIGTLDLLKKKTMELRAPEAKTERARITRAKEWGRLGLETTGFLGIMPLYKDVRKVFMGYTYKELKKETKETAVKKKAEEIKTALTDSQKISSLRKMRSSGRYTDKEINKAIRIIKDPEYKKAFNDKEEAIKKKILDKYGYDNKEDFERNDEKNYKIEFGKRSNYFQERAESAKIANELEKRVNALKDGVEYAPIKKTRKSSRSSYTGNSGYTGNSYTN